MKTKNEIARMNVELPKELHRKAKIASAESGNSIREMIIISLSKYLEETSYKKVNDCTYKNCGSFKDEVYKILEEVNKGENLEEVPDVKEFYRKLMNDA
jgi:hypothetical protein